MARSSAPPAGAKVSHISAHVPAEGQDPLALANARAREDNTMVYRVPRQAAQDLRDAMNQHEAEIAQLPKDKPLRFTHQTSAARQGYNGGGEGRPAVEATFRDIKIRIERLSDGSLHVPYFAPQATTKFPKKPSGPSGK